MHVQWNLCYNGHLNCLFNGYYQIFSMQTYALWSVFCEPNAYNGQPLESLPMNYCLYIFNSHRAATALKGKAI